jgi:hypothetical protein
LNPDSGILMRAATPVNVPQDGHTDCPPVFHVSSLLGIHTTVIYMRSLYDVRKMRE